MESSNHLVMGINDRTLGNKTVSVSIRFITEKGKTGTDTWSTYQIKTDLKGINQDKAKQHKA